MKINGELPKNYLYLEELKKWPTPSKFATINRKWLQPIYETTMQLQSGRITSIPTDKINHPILHFDRNDAAQILRPVLHAAFDFDLKDQTIEKFLLQARYPVDLNHTPESDITYLTSAESLQHCFATAKKIVEHAKGAILVIIGQSPRFIAAMIEQINQTLPADQKIQIIYLPFSGRPDLITLDREMGTWRRAYKDIVTPEREAFMRRFMRDCGFAPETLTKPVFLLDYSSGPSLAAFLLFVSKWFAAENAQLPYMVFLNLASKDDVLVVKEGKWQHLQKGQTLRLQVTDDLSFSITTIYLGMPKSSFVTLADVHDDLRVIPSFNALFWRPQILELFNQYPRPNAQMLLDTYTRYASAILHDQ